MNDAVTDFITRLNRTWQKGDLQALGDFYHADAILLPPDAGPPIVGRAAIVDSYREFADAASLLGFTMSDLDVYSFEAGSQSESPDNQRDEKLVHMAHMQFDVAYELDGTIYEESGLEIYTIVQSQSGFEILWRNQHVLGSRSR